MVDESNLGSHKSWAFTCNNWTEDDKMVLLNMPPALFTYIIFGEEIAPTTGTPHLQGYIVFRKAHRLTSVKRNLNPRFSLSVARKGDKANERYCSKGSNIVVRDYRYGRNNDPFFDNLVTLSEKRADPNFETRLRSLLVSSLTPLNINQLLGRK